MDMSVDRTRQNLAFHIAAKAHIIFGTLRMCHTDDVLFDDWPLIEVGSNIVRSGADKLYPAFESLLIRVRTFEGRKERMVDIDDPPRHRLTHLVRQNLHIARENDEIRSGVVYDPHLGGLRLSLVFLRDPDVMEGDVVVHDNFLIVKVVRDHGYDVDWQRTNSPPVEEIVEAVAKARNHHDNLSPLTLVIESVRHVERRGNRGKVSAKRFEIDSLFAYEA